MSILIGHEGIKYRLRLSGDRRKYLGGSVGERNRAAREASKASARRERP